MSQFEKEIRIAVLDMNKGHTNQGMGNILELLNHYKAKNENVSTIDVFDVRSKGEIPEAKNYDIFFSSGGPGDPHEEDAQWFKDFSALLDEIWLHNLYSPVKKYVFLICHSFQLAVIHWDIATINLRKSFSFGVMPVHKTKAGKKFKNFKGLEDPFYAIDSRAYQCVEPKRGKMREMGMRILALEKKRPYVKLERAVMAIRFSKEIFGTQFHPEANAQGFLKSMLDPTNKEAMIRNYGLKKYEETLDRIDDHDKIELTQSVIIPRFLKSAGKNLMKAKAEALTEKT